MKGQRIGYIRVSTDVQNVDRQLEGIDIDRKFIDVASGKNKDRPAFQEMIRYIREGDLLIVHSLDRLGRNMVDILNIVESFIEKGIGIQFVKDNMSFSKQPTAVEKLILQTMASFAEFERNILKERQREGIEIAKAKGLYKGRRRALKLDQVIELNKKVEMGIPKARVAREFGISVVTLYEYLKDYRFQDSLDIKRKEAAA